jgi:transposase
LRKLLMHGARVTLRWVELRTDSRSLWIRGLLARRGWNRTAVAVANKHARIVWVLLSRGSVYGEHASEKPQAGTITRERLMPRG